MEQPRSKFSFLDLIRVEDKRIQSPIIIITDEYDQWIGTPGIKTVTNDIDRVVEFICDLRNILPADRLWIYRDSLGQWAGYDVDESDFYPIVIIEANIFSLIINSPEVQTRLKQFPNEV